MDFYKKITFEKIRKKNFFSNFLNMRYKYL